MKEEVTSYKLGSIQVTVVKAHRPHRLNVKCFDGEYQSEFEVSEYEFTNYKRLMNQKIVQRFAEVKEEAERKPE